jgi:hypothetical protein
MPAAFRVTLALPHAPECIPVTLREQGRHSSEKIIFLKSCAKMIR